MGKFLKVFFEVVVGLAVLGAAVFFFMKGGKREGAAQVKKSGATNEVVVAVVEARMTSDRLEAMGTGRARESVVVTASESERVAAVFFEDGETVEAGRLLAQLEERLLRAELGIARTTLADERREMERAKELLEKEGIARRLVDARETSLAKAELAVEAIETRLKLREVRAPFAGVLGLRRVSEGAWVTPGTVITTLDDVSEIFVDFTVPEKYLAALATGVVFEARTPVLPGEALVGRVTGLEPRIDPQSLTALARGTLANAEGRLRPGMLFTVWLDVAPRMSSWLPEKAVVSLGERQFVFVETDGKVSRREVWLGRREAGMVEAREGVNAGERVVTDGVGKMREGMSVKISNVQQRSENRDVMEEGGRE